MKLIIRLLINAAALWAAAQIVDGVTLEGSFATILFVALIFGIVNAIVRPILTIFSLPFIIVTLGLFVFVLNALMLMLTDAISSALTVDGFGAALLGSLVISVVSWLLGVFLKDDDKQKKND
ncbi:phage holin family protein [Candidatus Leptofilum sp.]|uniref:phage holin family protein n=1 Tax=Candidatus Leptofilum sp. TaxID=3241576 RepID=UPI003B5BF427